MAGNTKIINLNFRMIVLCIIIRVLQISGTNIRQLHMVFRHGERSPSELYPKDPNTLWPDGLGYLTTAGKLQMYELGQRIRKKYGDTIPNYYFPEDTKVLSSYSDRCLMSAQLFTSGLFVPKYEQIWNADLLWQPIPISYKPRNLDNMLASKQNCTKYDIIYKELFATPKYQKILEENIELFEYLTKNTGMKVNSIRKVEELYNTLQIEQLHNLTLPKWSEKVFPNSMKTLAALSLASFTETDFMKKIKGGPFVEKFLNDMKESLINENAPSLFIYSGHDLTLVNILRTLGFTDEIKPNFAAYLIFALSNDSPAEIKIIYSNCGWCQEEELYIKNCMNSCTLENFAKTVNHLLPQNWTQECNE